MAVRFRFHVEDDICGVVDAFPTQAQAADFAFRHATEHADHEEVMVFDSHARHGRPDTWAVYSARLADIARGHAHFLRTVAYRA